MKRVADQQINKDNPEAADSGPEDPAQPRVKADAATLAGRRILRAKRRLPQAEEAVTAAVSTSPFAGLSAEPVGGPVKINLFGALFSDASTASSEAKAEANPFSGLFSSAAEKSEQELASKETQKVSNPGEFWKCQVEAIYRRRNPLKLASVEGLLAKYKGSEATLYAKVCKTYDLDPSRFYSDPKSWETYEQDAQADGDESEQPDASDSAAPAGVSVPSLFGGAVSVPSLFGITACIPAMKPEAKGDSDSDEVAPSDAAPEKGDCKTQ